MIFMTHPEHGAIYAKAHEVVEREADGWRVTSKAEWLKDKIPTEPQKFELNPKGMKKNGNR